MKFPQSTSSGQLTVIATLKVVPGKETRMVEIMADSQLSALSDAEPNTLEYRVTRILEADGAPTSTFVIIEKYNGPKGVQEHASSAGTMAMMKAFKEEGILAGKPVMQFCDELPVKALPVKAAL